MDKKSILKQIREHLRNAGFETYYPTQHTGDCLSEYVVIAYEGAVENVNVSSVTDTYSLMCYVPKNNYSRTVEFAKEVRDTMRNMFPLVRESGGTEISYYDEDVKGHMISLEYVNYRQIKYRDWR